MRSFGLLIVMITAAGPLRAQGPQPAPSAAEIVDRLEKTYDDIETLTASFQQISVDRGISQQEKGVLFMKKPGRMFWEYTTPTHKYFVADGQKSYFWNVDRRQVVVSDLDWEATDTPLLYLLGRSRRRLADDYRIEYERGQEDVGDGSVNDGRPTDPVEIPNAGSATLIRLTPLEARPDIEFLLMEVDVDRNLIRRLSVVDPIGNRNDYILSDFRLNVPIPDKQFKLLIPRGVEHIKQ